MGIELKIASTLTRSQIDLEVWAHCRILMSMKEHSQLVGCPLTKQMRMKQIKAAESRLHRGTGAFKECISNFVSLHKKQQGHLWKADRLHAGGNTEEKLSKPLIEMAISKAPSILGAREKTRDLLCTLHIGHRDQAPVQS